MGIHLGVRGRGQGESGPSGGTCRRIEYWGDNLVRQGGWTPYGRARGRTDDRTEKRRTGKGVRRRDGRWRDRDKQGTEKRGLSQTSDGTRELNGVGGGPLEAAAGQNRI